MAFQFLAPKFWKRAIGLGPQRQEDDPYAAQRALEAKQVKYFSDLMDKPDFGYETSRTPALQEDVANAYSSLGFGPQHVGPQGYQTARDITEDRNRWRQWVLSGGRAVTSPAVPRFMQPPRQNPWAALIGPLMGAAGYGIGGPIGGMIGGGVGNMFGMQQNPYTGVWQRGGSQ